MSQTRGKSELIDGIPADLFDLGVTDGTDGQVLSTDGAGALTFVDQTGGGAGNIEGELLSGTGAQTAFTLPFTPVSKDALLITINNGRVVDTEEFEISGTTLTFDSAPATGTNNIYVRNLGSSVALNEPADGSVTQAKLAADTSIQYATRYLAADISGSDVADIASLKFSNIPIGRKVVVSLTVLGQAVSENVIVSTVHDGNTISSFYIKDDDQGGAQSTILSEPFVTTSGVISFGTSSIANANDIIRGNGTALETHVTVYVYPNSALSENLGLI